MVGTARTHFRARGVYCAGCPGRDPSSGIDPGESCTRNDESEPILARSFLFRDKIRGRHSNSRTEAEAKPETEAKAETEAGTVTAGQKQKH